MKRLMMIAIASFLAIFALLAASPLHAQGNEILVANINGPVTPAMAAYFERVIEQGQQSGASAVLIVLDTPGGLVGTTQKIVQTFRSADLPVIVYIAPSGAQAASAGSLITAAAHIAAMAPETVVGAASPVDGSGADLEETIYRKQVEDLKATMRNLTERRGEDAVELAESMIENARAVTAGEALETGFVDVIAADIPDLLNQIDGMIVSVNGRDVTLQTANAVQQPVEMGLVEGILYALSNPVLISILLSIGPLAIIIEISHPGGWVAGFIGVVCIGLALYGLGTIEANFLGLILIGLSFILMLLEIKTPTIGALAITGTLTLIAGLLVLFNTAQTPQFARLPVPVAVSVSLPTAAFFLFIVTKALQAQRRPPITGSEGMVGQTGPVKKAFKPVPGRENAFIGTVLVMGELWRAIADEPLESGEQVVVKMMEGFTLHVKRIYNRSNGSQPVSTVSSDSQAA
ncbi:MAG: nodulation protein NfeD [Candidatus Promineifilaceae bacterium]